MWHLICCMLSIRQRTPSEVCRSLTSIWTSPTTRSCAHSSEFQGTCKTWTSAGMDCDATLCTSLWRSSVTIALCKILTCHSTTSMIRTKPDLPSRLPQRNWRQLLIKRSSMLSLRKQKRQPSAKLQSKKLWTTQCELSWSCASSSRWTRT